MKIMDVMPKKQPSKRGLVILAIVICILITAGGISYYIYQANSIRSESLKEFKTISDLKISQITNWNDERVSDIKVISNSLMHSSNVQKWIENPNDYVLKGEILTLLKSVKSYYQYDDIIISSASGKVLLDINGTEISQIFLPKHMIDEVVQEKTVAFSDLYICPIQNEIHFDIAAPIQTSDETPIAVLIFRVEPNNFLFPLIQEWPTNSKSAETLIFRQEGDSVLFLNELRHIKNTALKLKIALSKTEVPAVQAALGRRGFFEGYDYRNVKVLSYLSEIPNTSWMMIAKIDYDEIFEELNIRAVTIVIFSLLLMMLTGGGLVFIYSSSQKNIYKELFEHEKQLRETQEEFRTILYSIGDAVITTDKEGVIQQMNHVAEELTGWSESEANGMPLDQIFKIVNSTTKEVVSNPAELVIESGNTVGLANDTLLISKDGSEYLIADSGAPIKDSEGETKGVVIIFRDQTEEYNRQKHIAESEVKFRSVFENSPLGKSMTQPDGTLNINDSFCKILGYSREELISKNWKEITYPDDIEESEQIVQSIMKGETNEAHYQKRYLHKSGRIVWTDVNTTLHKDEKGKPQFFITTIQDITKEKETEQKSKISEKKFRDLFNSVSIPLCYVTEDGKLETINNRFISDLGYTLNDVPDLDAWWVTAYPDSEYRKWVMENWEKAVNKSIEEGGDIESDIYKVTCKDGSVREIIIAGITIGKDFLATFIDVTEQRNAERIILREKELTESVINAMPGIFYLFDQDGKFIKWNRTLANLSGFEFDDIKNKSPLDFIAPSDHEKIMKAINTAFTEGEVYVEADFLDKGKENIPFYFTGKRIMYDGKPFLLGVGIDISRRKLAELEKAEALEERDRFFNVSLDLLCIAGTDGYFKQMNPAWESTLGWSIDELTSKPFFEFIHPDDIEPTAKEVEKLKDGRPTVSFINRYLHKDGSYHWLNWTTAPYGDILYASAIDITELKLAEDKLLESENRLMNVFNNSPVSIWEEDWTEVIKMIRDLRNQNIDNHETYFNENMNFVNEALSKVKILSINKETQIMFKAKDRDALVKSLNVVFATDDTLPGFIGELVALAEGKTVYETEMKLNTVEGDTIDTLLRMTFPSIDDNSGQVLVSIMDISGLKEVQMQLKQTLEDLKRSNEELEQFAYVASHDLQEPLRMVSSYTQLLEKRYKEKLDDDAKDFIHYAVDGANRMQILINDLLQYSRVTTRGKEFEMSDLNLILGQAIVNTKGKIEETKAIITNEELPEAIVDSSQIVRVFQNLITNAIKYRSEESPKIHISSSKSARQIEIKIKDNGIGIAPEFHERIFEIFERLHTRDQYEGTGIGLAICKRIVERHGGRIWVESKLGEGSTFHFTIKKNI